MNKRMSEDKDEEDNEDQEEEEEEAHCIPGKTESSFVFRLSTSFLQKQRRGEKK